MFTKDSDGFLNKSVLSCTNRRGTPGLITTMKAAAIQDVKTPRSLSDKAHYGNLIIHSSLILQTEVLPTDEAVLFIKKT
jgi:hypothetical protein